MKIIGIDEVGRGSLISSVYSVATYFDVNEKKIINSFLNYFTNDFKDSKKITQKKRAEIFHFLKNKVKYAIGMATVAEVDNLNILYATKLSMQRAYNNLNIKDSDFVFIDGNSKIDIQSTGKILNIIKGDEKECVIACSSIFAKYIRDIHIIKLHSLFPLYQWDKNKGYGTKDHLRAIEKFGFTCFHRKTFNPVKQIIKKHYYDC